MIVDVSGWHKDRLIDRPFIGTKTTIKVLLAGYGLNTMPVFPRKGKTYVAQNNLHLVTVSWLDHKAPNGRDRLFQLVHSMPKVG